MEVTAETATAAKECRVAILTQGLFKNYGGILQNFALQRILERGGLVPYTVKVPKLPPFRDDPVWRKAVKLGSDILGKILRRNKTIRPWNSKKKVYDTINGSINFLSEKTHVFVRKNIRQTVAVSFPSGLDVLKKYHFHAYLVGSDQVWRPKFSPWQPAYFLDFAEEENVVRASYAASFGTDKMEMSGEDIAHYKPLLQKFDLVSVREASGVDLCRDYFAVAAEQVLDPTLLLDAADYEKTIPEEMIRKERFVFSYILDDRPKKKRFAEALAERMNARSCRILLPNPAVGTCVPSRIAPYVEDWLRNIRDAETIVTDSFHGAVFAILFRKNFWIFDNPGRGSSRIASLLEMLGLKDRLISKLDELPKDMPAIEYDAVFSRITKMRQKSMSFLTAFVDKCKGQLK